MIVQLAWAEGNPNQAGDGFRIYRSVNGGAYEVLDELPLTQTAYEDGDVSPGNVYIYRVCEYCLDAESPFCEGMAAVLVEGGTGADALRLTARVAQDDAGAGADAGQLEGRLSRQDSGACVDALVSHAVALDLADAASGEDVTTEALRDVLLYESADAGAGVEDYAAAAAVSGRERAWAVDRGAPVATVDGEDAGRGKERVRMAVKRHGEPWGLTAVTLEAIQR